MMDVRQLGTCPASQVSEVWCARLRQLQQLAGLVGLAVAAGAGVAMAGGN